MEKYIQVADEIISRELLAKEPNLLKAVTILRAYALLCKHRDITFLPFNNERILFRVALQRVLDANTVPELYGWQKEVTTLCKQTFEIPNFYSKHTVQSYYELFTIPLQTDRVEQLPEIEPLFNSLAVIVTARCKKLGIELYS